MYIKDILVKYIISYVFFYFYVSLNLLILGIRRIWLNTGL